MGVRELRLHHWLTGSTKNAAIQKNWRISKRSLLLLRPGRRLAGAIVAQEVFANKTPQGARFPFLFL